MSLHPSILAALDPEYIAFHNAHLTSRVPTEDLPWDPAIREQPTVPGTTDPVEIGKIIDYDIPPTKVRVFTPKGDPPTGGWPVLVWFHGGGWTLGNLSSDASFVTRVVTAANCVVVSVDYRLAPENPYPAAVEDAISALQWVYTNGPTKISINASRIAVGGSSSGGNLAAMLALKAPTLSTPIPLLFQLLIVPVLDNTLNSTSAQWKKNIHTTWLTPRRMEWFQNNYLPNLKDRSNWDASPGLAPKELLKGLPKTWIGVCELDILAAEAIEWSEVLKEEGIEVEIETYKGAPHPIMAMDGIVLAIGRKMVADAGQAVARAFSQTK